MLCDAKPFFYLEKSGKLIKVFGTDIMKRKGEGRRSKMKRLLGYLKDYRCRTVIAPLFKCLEACFELLVPLVVADMIDNGIRRADNAYILRMAHD